MMLRTDSTATKSPNAIWPRLLHHIVTMQQDPEKRMETAQQFYKVTIPEEVAIRHSL